MDMQIKEQGNNGLLVSLQSWIGAVIESENTPGKKTSLEIDTRRGTRFNTEVADACLSLAYNKNFVFEEAHK